MMNRSQIRQEIHRFAQKYHGYFFSWAIVYTIGYYPLEAISGDLMGSFNMFQLLLQGSLFFTRIHINRWWTFTQEALVLVHGTLVAAMQANGIWPMFAFGFGGIFIIMQLHGLGFPRWLRALLIGLYSAAAMWVYSGRGWANLNEIIRIPLIDYLAVLVLAGIFSAGLWVNRRFWGINSQTLNNRIQAA